MLKITNLSGRRWYFVAAICLILAMHSASSAQESSGKVIGNVTDPKGSVIPEAKVTVTNVGTQVSREATTNSDGNFEVLLLPIGSYRVTAERPGFKKTVSEVEKLQINQSLRFDIKMEVGSQSETVTVTSQASGVETVSPTLGQSVTSRPIVNLPLNGRNVLQLALLQPGVSENNPGDTSAGIFNIAGNRSDSVTFLLDGGVNNNLLNNGVVYNPNPDTIAEFRLLTSNYTAEYGRNGGGVISVVTKSGTNAFHGSGFEFLRNNALNANRFFNNANRIPREILKRNQFGFTVGGPITIPKVLKGKDRFFFFVGYQGQRQVASQTTASITTFTPAELKGDFSHSGPGGTPDAAVAAFLLANPIYQPNAALAAQAVIGRIDPVSQKYISAGLIPTSSTGQIISQGGATDNRDELTLRFDANLTSKNILVVTLGSSRNPNIAPFSAVNVSGFPILGNQQRRFANISFTKIFTPSFINDFRFTAQRSVTVQAVPAKTAPTAAALGIAITPDNPSGPPRLGFANGLTLGFSPQGPTTLINNTFSTTDTVSWTKGKHGLKFGGGYTPYQNNTVYDFYVNGEFDFYGPDTFVGSGNDLADFVLGLPDEYFQFGEAPSDIRSHNIYGFVQDEWRVRPNLTLTLGLRYEYSSPKLDTRGRSFSLKYGAQSTVFPNAPRGLLFPGDAGAPVGANFPDKNDWAPRFGFAWDPFKNGRTSVRGGFGVFYDILKGEDNLQFNGQAPFFGFVDLFLNQGTDAFGAPFTNAGAFNPFPSKPPAKNINFADACGGACGGGGVYFVDPNLRTPYTYQYNLSLQRELVRNFTMEASYVGSTSHKLTTLVDANPFILGTTHRVFNAQPGNTDGSLSYLLEFRNVGKANYNSMQLSLNKQYSNTRFLGNTYFTLAYTWAHSIDNSSGFRNRNSQVPAYNSDLFKASSDFDIRHRLTFSGGWDLPFDRAWSSGPTRLTQGWSLYPVFSWRTGFPLDIFAPLSASRTSAGPSAAGDRQIVRANLTGATGPTSLGDPRNRASLNNPCTGLTRTGNFWFNPGTVTCNGLPSSATAIANPALRTYGSLPRNSFRGPGRTNLDLGIAKVTPIFREKLSMEIKAEFFNVLNHTEFANPSTNISSSLFGQITTTFDPRIIQFGLKLIF
ncbi:MAG TPA: TonB-dependent receptor [Pyrinomonadaceae bacterium]|nr:TonB-dependent receptor [Pyrinomonadaceae bacterium]